MRRRVKSPIRAIHAGIANHVDDRDKGRYKRPAEGDACDALPELPEVELMRTDTSQ